MRILVVGTVPPPGGASARALAAEATRLADEGHDVEVLSPDQRASSHVHARLSGFTLPFRLAAASRRFDALLLRLEPRLPFRPTTKRTERAALGAALSWAVRGFAEVTLWVDSPVPIPSGPGGRTFAGFWGKAAHVVVGSEEDRLQLLAIPGMDPGRVTVATVAEPEEHLPADGWPSGGSDPRAEVLDLVRSRAVATRRLALAGARLEGARERVAELEAGLEAASAAGLAELLLVEGDPTLDRRAVSRLLLRRALREPRWALGRGVDLVLRPGRALLRPLRRAAGRARRMVFRRL